MIKLQEIIPLKLSGKSSILVSFNYNPEIVNFLKTLQPAVFHKKISSWEISASYLTTLLDTLVFYDDIEFSILPDEITGISQPPLTQEEIDSFKIKPFDHQVAAINYGLANQTGKFLLLDSMGVGKSAESMYIAETLYNRGLIKHCLIICGVDSLRTNWKSEIAKFSKFPAVVLGEYQTRSGKSRYKPVKERCEQLVNEISEFFIIVNAATVGYDQFVEAFNKSKNKIDMVIVDEVHRFATKTSNRGSNLLKINAKYKLAMTGSLITNSPLSCYVPLCWTENDSATLTNYKSQYCKFGGFNNSQIIGYKNLGLLQEEIAACSLRRTFDQIKSDMPLKTIDYEYIEMAEDQDKFYEAIKNGVKEEADKIDLKTGNLLALTTRLRQATSAPSVLTTENISACKTDRAVQIAEELLESGEKVVIFSTFIEPTADLATRLDRFHPLLATGKIDDDVVQRNIDAFRTSTEYNLLICTIAKLGVGFSLPECHYSVFLDTPWTNAAFSQAVDRIYRITSNQPVYIKVLIAKDTIDERVKYIVEQKRDLQDLLVDGKENALSRSLQDEMRSILKEL